MKKYLLSTFAVITALTVGTAANAQTSMMDHAMNHMYGRIDAGWAIGASGTEDAAVFDVGLGARLNQYFRTDLTAEYRPWGKQKFTQTGAEEKTDMYSLDAMMNVYAEYPIMEALSIYATGGIGYAYNRTDDSAKLDAKGKSNFAWNVGAGIEYAVTECMSIDLGYRFSDLGKARAKVKETGDAASEKVRYNDIKLGLKYYF